MHSYNYCHIKPIVIREVRMFLTDGIGKVGQGWRAEDWLWCNVTQFSSTGAQHFVSLLMFLLSMTLLQFCPNSST